MKFWAKPKKTIVYEKIRETTLRLKLKSEKEVVTVSCVLEDGEHSTAKWKKFLKWFHGKPSKEYYVMPLKDGSWMFYRKDLISYQIQLRTYNKEVK